MSGKSNQTSCKSMLFVGAVPADECRTSCTLESCSNNHLLQSSMCQVNPVTEDMQHFSCAERIQTSLSFFFLNVYAYIYIYKNIKDLHTLIHASLSLYISICVCVSIGIKYT